MKLSAAELRRMAKKLYRDARARRKLKASAYGDGVIRGLHEAAASCLRRAKRLSK